MRLSSAFNRCAQLLLVAVVSARLSSIGSAATRGRLRAPRLAAAAHYHRMKQSTSRFASHIKKTQPHSTISEISTATIEPKIELSYAAAEAPVSVGGRSSRVSVTAASQTFMDDDLTTEQRKLMKQYLQVASDVGETLNMFELKAMVKLGNLPPISDPEPTAPAAPVIDAQTWINEWKGGVETNADAQTWINEWKEGVETAADAKLHERYGKMSFLLKKLTREEIDENMRAAAAHYAQPATELKAAM